MAVTSQATRAGTRRSCDDLEEAGARIHRRRPAEREQQRRRLIVEHGGDELAEAAAGRCERVEPMRIERNGGRSLDDGRPVRETKPARAPRAAERIVHLGLEPVAAEREPQRLGGPLAAVGDRQLFALRRRPREAPPRVRLRQPAPRGRP